MKIKIDQVLNTVDLIQKYNKKLIMSLCGTPVINKMMWIDIRGLRKAITGKKRVKNEKSK